MKSIKPLLLILGLWAVVDAYCLDRLTLHATPDNGVVVNPRFAYYTTDPYHGNTFIPYSLGVTWDNIAEPYVFDKITYKLNGVSHTAYTPIIGEQATLQNDDGQWLITDIHLFFRIPFVTITINTTASPATSGIARPQQTRVTVLRNEEWGVQLEAAPKEGYRFLRWRSASGKTAQPPLCHWRELAGLTNTTVDIVAEFAPRNTWDTPCLGSQFDPDSPTPDDQDWEKYSYIVVYTETSPSGIANVTPESGVVYVGLPGSARVVQCAARLDSADVGFWEFRKWSGNVDIYQQTYYSGKDGGVMRAAIEFPSPAGAVRIARFSAEYKPYSKTMITATATPAHGGIIRGAGAYDVGETCTLVAHPCDAKFLRWTDATGAYRETNPTYSFVVTNDESFTGQFHPWTGLPIRSADMTHIIRAGTSIVRDAAD